MTSLLIRRKVDNSPSHVVMKQPQNSQRSNRRTNTFMFEYPWSNGLCGIATDVPTCAFAFLCFPCFLCYLDRNAHECAMTTCCTGIVPGLAMQRAKVRARFRIEGSAIEDFFYSQCCPCCTALQLHYELVNRGEIVKV